MELKELEHSKAPSVSWFVADSQEYVLWIQFGDAKNNIDSFWKLFKRGLRGWDKLLASQIAELPFPKTAPEIHKLLDLLRRAAARTGSAIIVFDGLQQLPEGPIRNLVFTLANTITEGLSTVLIAGDDVNVGTTAALRASRLTRRNLQFSREEIRIYYTALGIVLDRGMLEEIWKITGGWEPGVRLLGKHLPPREPLTASILDNAVTCTYETFAAEYFLPFREAVRQAILLLSLLDNFTMDLAIELTGLPAEEIIALYDRALLYSRSNSDLLFFHNFYHRWLKLKQFELPKDRQREFLRRAARWHEANGNLMEALHCSASCADYDQLLHLVLAIPPHLLQRDQAVCICEWLVGVPNDYMAAHPELRLRMILVLRQAGHEREFLLLSEELRRELENKSCNEEESRVLGELTIDAAYLYWADCSDGYKECFQKAVALLPQGSSVHDCDNQLVPGGSELRFSELAPGSLTRINEMNLGAMPLVRSLFPKTGAGKGYLFAAETHLLRMELDQARDCANLALREAGYSQTWGIACEANYTLSRICLIGGSLDDYLHYCKQISFCAQRKWGPSPEAEYDRETSQAHIAVALGLYHLVSDEWARENPMIQRAHTDGAEESRGLFAHIMRTVFVEQQYYPAISLIEYAIPVYHKNRMWCYRLKLVILKAIVYAKLDKPSLAANYLMEAHALSEGNDILFPYVEFGRHLTEALRAIRPLPGGQTIPDQWLERLDGWAEQYERNRSTMAEEYIHRHPHLARRRIEALTKKEYHALRLLCRGLSTEDIAKQMGVHAATVNTYLYRGYKKIGASNRKEAVQIAAAEGLLIDE